MEDVDQEPKNEHEVCDDEGEGETGNCIRGGFCHLPNGLGSLESFLVILDKLVVELETDAVPDNSRVHGNLALAREAVFKGMNGDLRVLEPLPGKQLDLKVDDSPGRLLEEELVVWERWENIDYETVLEENLVRGPSDLVELNFFCENEVECEWFLLAGAKIGFEFHAQRG